MLITLSLSIVYGQEEKKCLDMKTIRNQRYLSQKHLVNCDSVQGSILELRICANLRLQREDSIMNFQLRQIELELSEKDATKSLEKIKEAQTSWLLYRCHHCNPLIKYPASSSGIIEYMNCNVLS
jgi:uncharacterized protein YecT (DUF1311 family)